MVLIICTLPDDDLYHKNIATGIRVMERTRKVNRRTETDGRMDRRKLRHNTPASTGHNSIAAAEKFHCFLNVYLSNSTHFLIPVKPERNAGLKSAVILT